MALHVLTVLNELTPNDDESIKHVTINATFFFFMGLAVFHLLIVLEDLHVECGLCLKIANVAYRLGKVGELVRQGSEGGIVEGPESNIDRLS